MKSKVMSENWIEIEAVKMWENESVNTIESVSFTRKFHTFLNLNVTLSVYLFIHSFFRSIFKYFINATPHALATQIRLTRCKRHTTKYRIMETVSRNRHWNDNYEKWTVSLLFYLFEYEICWEIDHFKTIETVWMSVKGSRRSNHLAFEFLVFFLN